MDAFENNNSKKQTSGIDFIQGSRIMSYDIFNNKFPELGKIKSNNNGIISIADSYNNYVDIGKIYQGRIIFSECISDKVLTLLNSNKPNSIVLAIELLIFAPEEERLSNLKIDKSTQEQIIGILSGESEENIFIDITAFDLSEFKENYPNLTNVSEEIEGVLVYNMGKGKQIVEIGYIEDNDTLIINDITKEELDQLEEHALISGYLSKKIVQDSLEDISINGVSFDIGEFEKMYPWVYSNSEIRGNQFIFDLNGEKFILGKYQDGDIFMNNDYINSLKLVEDKIRQNKKK